MSSLFGSKSSKSTTVVDPWTKMPDWMKEALKDDAAFRQDLLGDGKDVAEFLGDNPREVLGLSDDELLARDNILGGIGDAEMLGGTAADRLGTDYESEYTDDVVETTLAGMQRKHDRDQLARDAAAAAVGGTSNSRAAVGDAVAENLTGLSMAEMEAKLRDEGFRFGAEMGLQETDMYNEFANDALSRSVQGGGAIGAIGEVGRGLEQEQMDEERTADQQALSWLANIFSGTNTSYGPQATTQTSETPAPSTFSQLAGAAATGAGIYMSSDERGKEEIADPDGSALDKLALISAREYKYKPDFGHTRDRTTGLMAQDLERAGIVGAVHEGEDGMKMVDPYPVLATVVQAVKELDRRTS